MVAPLLTERFSVVALDQRSHGENAGTTDGYDFVTITNDLKLFLEALEAERPILVGHSWGGNVVLELAAAHPDAVVGLVFVDGGFINLRSKPGATWEEMERNMAPPDLTHLTMEELVARAPARWGSMWGQQPVELYPKAKVPVLILPTRRQGVESAGAGSRVPKEELVAQAETLLPRARTVWLEDSIHDVPLQRPQLVADIILQVAGGVVLGTETSQDPRQAGG